MSFLKATVADARAQNNKPGMALSKPLSSALINTSSDAIASRDGKNNHQSNDASSISAPTSDMKLSPQRIQGDKYATAASLPEKNIVVLNDYHIENVSLVEPEVNQTRFAEDRDTLQKNEAVTNLVDLENSDNSARTQATSMDITSVGNTEFSIQSAENNATWNTGQPYRDTDTQAQTHALPNSQISRGNSNIEHDTTNNYSLNNQYLENWYETGKTRNSDLNLPAIASDRTELLSSEGQVKTEKAQVDTFSGSKKAEVEKTKPSGMESQSIYRQQPSSTESGQKPLNLRFDKRPTGALRQSGQEYTDHNSNHIVSKVLQPFNDTDISKISLQSYPLYYPGNNPEAVREREKHVPAYSSVNGERQGTPIVNSKNEHFRHIAYHLSSQTQHVADTRNKDSLKQAADYNNLSTPTQLMQANVALKNSNKGKVSNALKSGQPLPTAETKMISQESRVLPVKTRRFSATAPQQTPVDKAQAPKVQIGQVDIFIQTSDRSTPKSTPAPSFSDLASRHYLRSL